MLFENIEAALNGIKSNKMRSFLTMLGILIGIAAIIAIIMVGNGMTAYIADAMKQNGANRVELYITQKNWDSNNVEMKDSDYISDKMLADVEKKYEDQIESIMMSSSLGDGIVKDGKAYAKVSLTGENSGYINLDVGKDDLLAGRRISAVEQKDGTNVAMVSNKFCKNLYKGDNEAALGQNIDVLVNNKYYTYTIVGVYKAWEDSRATTSDYDVSTGVLVPLKAVHKVMSGSKDMQYIDLNMKTGVDSAVVGDEMLEYLNNTYYKNNDNWCLDIWSMKKEAEQLNQQIGMIKLAMGGIGAISLLVGGIGVMNIMIVSITERTREIGTRKALGATNGSIRLQFITEAIVICFIGGMMGLGLGIGLGRAITVAIGFPGSITVSNVICCLVFSIAFGVFFGYYPANRAAKMNPIDALRYE